MRIFLTCLLLLSVIISQTVNPDKSAGKPILSGYIKDKTNGEELINATVYVKELRTGTVTNLYGFYSISLSPGDYQLTFSYIGYKTEEKKISIKENITLNVELEPVNHQLGEVEVTGEKSNVNIKRPEMSVVKIQMQSIKRIPALMGEVDVIKAIQMLPGVQSTSEGTSSFSVRGGSADQNLILLDEATVYNASHLMGFFSIFNNDAIKDVKLYKGDIPASYGGRLSSLLDVRMKDGNSKVFSGTGGIGTISSRLTFEGPIVKDNTSFIVSGRRTYMDIFLPLSSNKDLRSDKLYFYDLNLKVNSTIDENNRLFLSGYFGRDVFKNPFAYMDFGNQTLTLRWNHLFSKNLFANTSLIYSNYNYNIGTPAGNPNSFLWTSNLTDVGGKLDFNYYPNTENTVRFGYQLTFHRFDPGTAQGLGDSTIFAKYSLPLSYDLEHGLYISNEQKIGSLLTLKYGIRLSVFQNVGPGTIYHFDSSYNSTDSTVYKKGDFFKTYAGLEPRLGLTYTLTEESSIKASYSRTLQYIQLASNSTAGTPLDIWFPASPNVRPQVSNQVATGYFRNFFNDQVETSVEVYYKMMDHVIDFKDFAQLLLNRKLEGEIRSGTARAYGAEFMVQLNTGKLNGWISYTLSHTERTINAINNGKPYLPPYDKPNSVNLVLNYEYSKRVVFAANWIYATGAPLTIPTGRVEVEGVISSVYSDRNTYRMPDYHRLDLSLTLKGKDVPGRKWSGEWNFSVYNAYARHNPWAIYFVQDEKQPSKTYAEKIYLFSLIPAITYNFKF
ncbi:MAG: TonB-dependent receptor [Bacteroidia bacterium]|nr:TonB-dependent receptor [Bacteroidia bacterium]